MTKQRPLTLMELLVVIGIITILASLLLPALEKGKDSALTLRCLNHHKQLTTYELLFADDNDGRFPGGGTRLGGSASWHGWYHIIQWEYLEDAGLGLSWRNAYKEGTLNCPDTKSSGGTWRVIGMNRKIKDQYSKDITDTSKWPKPPTDPANPQDSSYTLGSPMRKIKRPSEVILHQDWISAGNATFQYNNDLSAMNVQYFPQALDYAIKMGNAGPVLRHGTGNTLKNTRIYVDGHAKAVLPDPDNFQASNYNLD